MIYRNDFAEFMKDKAGKKWRPANSLEFDLFTIAMCVNCVSRARCQIIPLTMANSVEDEAYPEDWVIREDGQPVCTAFEAKNLDS